MHGFELFCGPTLAGFKFYAEKIAGIFENAIANTAMIGGLGVDHGDEDLQWNIFLELQTSSGQGDVLQIGHGLVPVAGFVAPLNLDQIRAQHPRVDSPLSHDSVIGLLFWNDYKTGNQKKP
jgi:hypothetical protein